MSIERDVYDAYPGHINKLVGFSVVLSKMPLEHMVAAIEKMTVTRAHIGPYGTLAVEPELLEGHKELIEAAIAFRNKYIELAVRATGS